MRLAVGTRLGPYEVVASLGAGGMGEVYKAVDTRLGRTVAIKILPPGLAADPDRRRRFEHEARAASALNHPHICTLHDIGQAAGVDYLVLELLEGETLAARLEQGPLPLDEALTTGAEIAEALAAAHRQGIVHRDLKPGNVMLTKAGAKLLDFGLAKLAGAPGAEAPGLHPDTAATRSAPLTAAGVVVGTLPYMAPEQLEGKPTDGRADIWALGTILHEMVTGKRAFAGDSQASLITAIMSASPLPLSTLHAKTPPALDHLVRSCLAKDPDKRRDSAHDIAEELRWLRETSGAGGRVPARRLPRRARATWIPIGIAGAALVAAIAAWLVWRMPQRPATALTATALTAYSGIETQPSFSPDGTKVAFVWNGEKEDNEDIYVKQIGAAGPPMRLTESPAREEMPAWSPDDRWIAFSRELEEQKKFAILLVSPLGGPERRLIEGLGAYANPRTGGYSATRPEGLCWTPDGKWLVFGGREPGQWMVISAVSVDTGERRRLTTFDGKEGDWEESGDMYPSISPDGRFLAFSRGQNYVRDIYVMRLTPDLRPAGDPVKVTDAHYSWLQGVAWAANGGDVIYGAGSIYAQFLWRVSASGKDAPGPLPFATREAVFPAVAHNASRLAYAWRLLNTNIWRLDTLTGERTPLIRSTYDSRIPQYSPDGRKIAFQSNRSGTIEVWTCDADGSNCQQLTAFGGPQCGTPRWSPDGRTIALDSRVEGRPEAYVVAADGGTPRRITRGDGFKHEQPSWSADGRWIYFNSDRGGQSEIWRMPSGGGEAVQLTRSGGATALGSPDGRYVYFVKSPGPRLYRMPAEGGAEQEVVPDDLVNWASFGVTATAVYFVTKELSLQSLDLASGKVTTLARVPVTWGMSVSPDGRHVVWSQTDRNTTDLMLVEGFR